MPTDYQATNQSILDDIAELQTLERDLFYSLENTGLSAADKNKILENINDLSNMRIRLYRTLGNMNTMVKDSLDTNLNSFAQQINAISIMETELNKSKERVSILENEKNNKLRLVEINNYYADKYHEHSKLMQIIIYTLIPIIVVNFIYSYGILPYSIFIGIIILIAGIGSYYFWNIFSSMMMRDNMNYDKYDWSIMPSSEPKAAEGSTRDPWLSGQLPGTCLGSDCCNTGMTYDYTLDKCIIGTTTGTTGGTTGTAST